MKIKATANLLLAGIFLFTATAQAGPKPQPNAYMNVNAQVVVDAGFDGPEITISCDQTFSVRSLFALTDVETIFQGVYVDTINGIPNHYGGDDEPGTRLDLQGFQVTTYFYGEGQGAELLSGLGVGNDLFWPGGTELYFWGWNRDAVEVWGSAIVETPENANCEMIIDGHID